LKIFQDNNIQLLKDNIKFILIRNKSPIKLKKKKMVILEDQWIQSKKNYKNKLVNKKKKLKIKPKLKEMLNY